MQKKPIGYRVLGYTPLGYLDTRLTNFTKMKGKIKMICFKQKQIDFNTFTNLQNFLYIFLIHIIFNYCI